MDDLAGWIGRSQTQDDEITRPALRRIAALLDMDDPGFAPGTPIPPHWYAMFFPEIARQSHLGDDGHPRRGDFLPPVPLPRRMFAGRRVRFDGVLRVGDVATKVSEILSVTPKTGRSGAMVFVTIRHSISVSGAVALIEEQDVVYRAAALPGAAAPPPPRAPVADWADTVTPSTSLLFRYSSVTWNTHRIHYDADYVRSVENYPDLVMNGGLTALLLIEAAIKRLGAPKGLEIRNVSPLFVNQTVTLAGAAPVDGAAAIWAANPDGGLATQVKFIL
jgi:3-methylfumaryl-CoA hydratase